AVREDNLAARATERLADFDKLLQPNLLPRRLNSRNLPQQLLARNRRHSRATNHNPSGQIPQLRRRRKIAAGKPRQRKNRNERVARAGYIVNLPRPRRYINRRSPSRNN